MINFLAGLLRSFNRERAARRYNRELGPRLRHDYGAAEFYTAPQIVAAAAKCRLPAGHIAIGYAAFMAAADFARVGEGHDYDTLHTLYHRHDVPRSVAGLQPAPNNPYAMSGFNGN